MEPFRKIFLRSIPLGTGIVFALISIAFTVNIADNGGGENQVIAAVCFGMIGFPMVIAGAIKLSKDSILK